MRYGAIIVTGLLVLSFGFAVQAGELITYQGRLTDDAGNPVSDGSHTLTFSLWDDSTAGSQLWSEYHVKDITDGLFSVNLGKYVSLDASIFETEPLFLQIQIDGGDIIEPRTRLTSAPSAIKAKKVDGDVETGQGYLNLNAPDSTLAVSITTEGKGSPAFFKMYNPGPDFAEQTLVQISSESEGGKFSLYPPGDVPSNPAFTVGLDPIPFNPGYMAFYDPSGSFPHDPYVKMGFDPTPFRGYLEFCDPGSGWVDDPMVRMGTEPSPFHMGFIAMYNPEISPSPKLMEMRVDDSTGVWTSSFSMFDYMAQPPDPYKVFEISNSPSTGVSLKMATPVPEPPPRVYLDINVNAESGPSMGFYDEVGQVMGLEPSPFNEGFSLYLIDPGDDEKRLEIMANHVTDEASIKIIDPGDDERPAVDISADPNGTHFNINRYDAFADILYDAVALDVDGINSITSFKLIDPGNDERPGFEMTADGSDNSASFRMIDPGDDEKSLILMNGSSGGGNIKMFNPQPEPPAVLMEMDVSQSGGNWEGSFNMYSIDPLDNNARNFELSNTLAGGANLKLFNAQPGKASTTVVDMYYDSTTGGGTVKCYSDHDDSWGLYTGRDFSMGNAYATNIYVNYGGGSYFAGYMGIGAFPLNNILEIQQSSPTDPIADAWTIYSSQRWKKNIQTIDGALDKIERLRGVSFDWISDDKHDVGMVAEEVGEVIPEVVTYEENGIDARSIDYNRLTAVLVEAIKELKSENEELKNRIEKLEAQ